MNAHFPGISRYRKKRGRSARPTCLALHVAACLVTGGAWAEPPDIQVTGGDERCPVAADLAARVRGILGDRAGELKAGGRRAVVVYRRTPKGWNAEVKLLGPHGKPEGARDLPAVGSDCGELAQPLGLVLGLLLDASSRQSVNGSTSPPAPGLPPSERRIASERWRGNLELGGALGANFQPKLSLSPALGVSLHAPSTYSFLARALWFKSQREQSETGGYDISQSSLRLAACVRLLGPVVEVPVCLGPEFAWIKAEGFGYAESLERAGLFARGEAGVGGRVRFSEGWSFSADALIGAAWPRYRVVAEDQMGGSTLLHRQDLVVASWFAGVGLDFF
ncbi:MAG: hypothetical protein SFV15_11340 [Polyangiaceae bacterium]|nr:hypothetical protein [Polyangiaceae bacterium]